MTLLLGDANLFGERPVIGAASGEVSVRLLDKESAVRTILDGHYSGTVAKLSFLDLGVWVGRERIGAMQYGYAMNPASGAGIVRDAAHGSWAELARLWLADEKPANTTSRALSLSLKVMRQLHPEIEWVQTFADERCGKLGGVYQAASFLYCGEHASTFYEIDGQWFHRLAFERPDVDSRGHPAGPRSRFAKANAHRAVEHTFRQFRYVKFLRRSARSRLLLPVLPYPKPGDT